MMLSKLVRVRVMVRMRVINQSNRSAGNKSGVYAVLGMPKIPHPRMYPLVSAVGFWVYGLSLN